MYKRKQINNLVLNHPFVMIKPRGYDQNNRGAPFGLVNSFGLQDASASCAMASNKLFAGSYVPAEHIQRSQQGYAGVGSSCATQSYSGFTQQLSPIQAGNADLKAGAVGISSRSLDVLGGRIPTGGSQCIDKKDPFSGLVIPEGRRFGAAMTESISPNDVYITNNYNQTHDLRGDLNIPVREMPTGASIPTRSVTTGIVPYRGDLY